MIPQGGGPKVVTRTSGPIGGPGQMPKEGNGGPQRMVR